MEAEDENKYSKSQKSPTGRCHGEEMPKPSPEQATEPREDSPASEKVGDEWREKAEVSGSPRRAGLPPATDWQLKVRWL